MAIVGASSLGMLAMAGSAYADEAEHGLAAPSYPWAHNGWFSSYDHASLVSFLCMVHEYQHSECFLSFCYQLLSFYSHVELFFKY